MNVIIVYIYDIMKSKSLSLINKLDEERRRLRLEEGKKYAEQKRKYLLKQDSDRKLKAVQVYYLIIILLINIIMIS